MLSSQAAAASAWHNFGSSPIIKSAALTARCSDSMQAAKRLDDSAGHSPAAASLSSSWRQQSTTCGGTSHQLGAERAGEDAAQRPTQVARHVSGVDGTTGCYPRPAGITNQGGRKELGLLAAATHGSVAYALVFRRTISSPHPFKQAPQGGQQLPLVDETEQLVVQHAAQQAACCHRQPDAGLLQLICRVTQLSRLLLMSWRLLLLLRLLGCAVYGCCPARKRVRNCPKQLVAV